MAGRRIVLHERDDLLRQARRDWADKPELREKYRQFRPNVERVISQIASLGGRRLKLRYHGTTKNNAWLKASGDLRAVLKFRTAPQTAVPPAAAPPSEPASLGGCRA
jgi:hypothetical protein